MQKCLIAFVCGLATFVLIEAKPRCGIYGCTDVEYGDDRRYVKDGSGPDEYRGDDNIIKYNMQGRLPRGHDRGECGEDGLCGSGRAGGRRNVVVYMYSGQDSNDYNYNGHDVRNRDDNDRNHSERDGSNRGGGDRIYSGQGGSDRGGGDRNYSGNNGNDRGGDRRGADDRNSFGHNGSDRGGGGRVIINQIYKGLRDDRGDGDRYNNGFDSNGRSGGRRDGSDWSYSGYDGDRGGRMRGYGDRGGSGEFGLEGLDVSQIGNVIRHCPDCGINNLGGGTGNENIFYLSKDKRG